MGTFIIRLTPPLYIDVSVSSQATQCHLFVLRGVHFASVYNYCIIFWNCTDSVVFFYFLLKRFMTD